MRELLDCRSIEANEGAAADDGERRLYRRYPAGLEAQLRLGGEAHPCTITDLSLGGAGIIPGLPIEKDAPVRLLSEHFERPQGLLARVVGGSSEVTHLAFELDEATEEALTLFLLSSPTSR